MSLAAFKNKVKVLVLYMWKRIFIDNKQIKVYPQKLLLIFPYGIGNTILANGAIKSLKKAYPAVSFNAVYMEEPTRGILYILGNFEFIIFWDQSFSLKQKLNFFTLVKREKFDMAIMFYANYDYDLNFVLMIAGIPVRIGFDFLGEMSSLFLSHAVLYDNKKSEFQNDLNLLNFLGIQHEHSIMFSVKKHKLPSVEVNRLKVGIHIGQFNSRRPGWPPERFLNLVGGLKKQYNAEFYIFGGDKERVYREYFVKNDTLNITDLIAKTSLEETVSYISQMDLFISNDTGLMHIAASQGVPLVAIFGPTDYVKSCPIIKDGGKVKILMVDVSCRPCYPNKVEHRLCRDKIDCLMGVSVADVLDSIRQLLSNTN